MKSLAKQVYEVLEHYSDQINFYYGQEHNIYKYNELRGEIKSLYDIELQKKNIAGINSDIHQCKTERMRTRYFIQRVQDEELFKELLILYEEQLI